MNYKNSKKVEKNLKFIQMNNKIYEGYVLEDELTGNGIIKTYDGDIYEGNFEKGELNGRGHQNILFCLLLAYFAELK